MLKSWTCPSCRTGNPGDAPACSACSQTFEIEVLRCPGCSLELPSLAGTCIQCGTVLAAEAATAQGRG